MSDRHPADLPYRDISNSPTTLRSTGGLPPLLVWTSRAQTQDAMSRERSDEPHALLRAVYRIEYRSGSSVLCGRHRIDQPRNCVSSECGPLGHDVLGGQIQMLLGQR